MAPIFQDPVWGSIREAAEHANEPHLASFLHSTILNHEHLESAVSFHIAGKLAGPNLPSMLLREVIEEAFRHDPNIGLAVRDDIRAVRDRDPAVNCCLVPFLFLKGVHTLISYRVAHWLWNQGRQILALHLQNRISEVFGADIHPAAKLGRGILIDHATSVVIGETAVVEDNVSMLHEVTLGGTGKETGDRHPKGSRGRSDRGRSQRFSATSKSAREHASVRAVLCCTLSNQTRLLPVFPPKSSERTLLISPRCA